MIKPKRSSDDYLKIRKTITNKEVRNIILILSREWMVEPSQVYDRIITERAKIEIEKRKLK